MVTKEQVKPVWKCTVEGCNYTAAPTVEGYKKISGHQLAHTGLPKTKRGFQLVDESTGEILAQKLEEATTKGFIATKPPEPATTPAPPSAMEIKQPEPKAPEVPTKVETSAFKKPKEKPPEDKSPSAIPEAEEGSKAEIKTVRPTGVFTYEVTLPADAFTLFNLAKACGLEPNDGKLFDEWLWDCVRARFSKDYKKQLVLAPLEE